MNFFIPGTFYLAIFLQSYFICYVSELPKRGPIIQTEKDRYDVGDFLKANCSSPPSKPGASLSFFLNENPVSERLIFISSIIFQA
ncbi:hypothetical protein O3M35_009225 [Rhynocoris fuscipes]|uniref:Uncharacterized protein n=1 Tax=Rhynocoris fuscipes TaxID=488301 RepID=A0AAW1D7H6_9HEMI